MELLRRIWRVARAEWPSGTQGTQASEEPPRAAHQGGGGASPGAGDARRHQHADAAPKPAQDPVLAGYYANLEIPYGSDPATVRGAWKRLLKTYHPDLHDGDPDRRRLANQLTAELNRAYHGIEQSQKAGAAAGEQGSHP